MVETVLNVEISAEAHRLAAQEIAAMHARTAAKDQIDAMHREIVAHRVADEIVSARRRGAVLKAIGAVEAELPRDAVRRDLAASYVDAQRNLLARDLVRASGAARGEAAGEAARLVRLVCERCRGIYRWPHWQPTAIALLRGAGVVVFAPGEDTAPEAISWPGGR